MAQNLSQTPADSESALASKASSRHTVSTLSLVFSIVITIAVVGSYGYLIFATGSLQSDLTRTHDSIATKKTAIDQLQKDRDIRAYRAYQTASGMIDSTIVHSEAQRYITELMHLSQQYNINFNGFNFSGDHVTTSATVTSLLNDNPTESIATFIEDYRDPTKKDTHLFHLAPVTSIAGSDARRSFSVDFSLNNNQQMEITPLSDISPSGSSTGTTITSGHTTNNRSVRNTLTGATSTGHTVMPALRSAPPAPSAEPATAPTDDTAATDDTSSDATPVRHVNVPKK